jgi:hypothetical protein
MIIKLATADPEAVRKAFSGLYNENERLLPRAMRFKSTLESLVKQYMPGFKGYQDMRAISVYLALRFPERYYFYKFEMFKTFCQKLEYSYFPVQGRQENLGLFFDLCELIKYEIRQDNSLLKLHQARLAKDCYADATLNLLTQDFIYAVSEYLDAAASVNGRPFKVGTVIHTDITPTVPEETLEGSFAPQKIDHVKRQIKNSRIGQLGELWVIEYEQNKLRKAGRDKLIAKIRHISQDEGDGAGYDILSFDVDKRELYIEVKTTEGRETTPFYITKTELARSVLHKERYHLYRVYNFNHLENSADLTIYTGALENLCTNPVIYKVQVPKT